MFLNSPTSESIFVSLIRGDTNIVDFKKDPIVLWFWRSKTNKTEVDSFLKEIPIERNFYLSGVLRWEAKEAKKNEEKYGKLNLATHFDSISIENHFSLISLAITTRNLNYLKSIFSFRIFSDFRNQIFFLTNFFLLILFALLFAGFIYVLVKFIRYLPVLSHRLEPTGHSHLKGIITSACFLAPILILRDLFLAFLIYSILLSLVFNLRERNWLRLNFIIIILLSVIFPFNDFVQFLKGSSKSYYLYQMATQDNDIKIKPETSMEKEILAYALKRQGKLDEALTIYEELYYNHNNRSLAVTNNLANLYYLYNEDERAEELYLKALSADRGEVFFNLGLLKLKNIEYLNATQYMEEARKRGFSSLTKQPVDIIPENKNFYNLILTKKLTLGGPIKPMYLLLLVFILFLTFLPFRFSSPYQCPVCGKPVCKDCLEQLEEEFFCEECFSKLKSTRSDEIEEELRTSLARNKNFLNRFLSLFLNILIPGAGLIYKNRNFVGLLIVFFATLAYLPLLFKNFFIKPTGWVALPLSPIFLFTGGLMLFFCYLFSFLLLRRQNAD